MNKKYILIPLIFFAVVILILIAFLLGRGCEASPRHNTPHITNASASTNPPKNYPIVCDSYPAVLEAFKNHPLCQNIESKARCNEQMFKNGSWIEFVFVRKGRNFEAEFEANGKFLELEETIPNEYFDEEVPLKVRDALKKHHSGKILIKIEKEIHADKTESFEFDICDNGQQKEVTYNIDGSRPKYNSYDDENDGGQCNSFEGMKI